MNTNGPEAFVASQRRRNVLICLCLAAVTAVVYGPVVGFGFVNYDDTGYVVQNQYVRGGFSWRGLAWAFTTTEQGNWHPLTWLSHMLDCQLFGWQPGPHHLVSLMIHIANALLLFFVLQRLTAAPWRSALVAALFAWHPMHVESAAWISERKDVLSTCFGLAAIWMYVRYVEQHNVQGSTTRLKAVEDPPITNNRTPATAFFILALLFFAVGLMAKPMVVTLPFVLLVLDYWPLGRTRWAPAVVGERTAEPLGRLVKEKTGFWVVAAVSCGVTYWAQRSRGAVVGIEDLSIGRRVSSATVAYVQYLVKAVWPVDLAVFYPHRDWPVAVVIGAAAVLILVTCLVFWLRKHSGHLVVGWLWYVGTLVPVIGLIQVGSQSMADRYTYVPFIGLFLMIAWTVPWSIAGRGVLNAGEVVTVMAALAICAVLAHRQVGYWESSETLFHHALAVTRDNAFAHFNLGNAQSARGKPEEAIAEYREALRITPGYVEAHNNLGLTLAGLSRTQEALAEYRESLRLDPRCAAAHNNLGNILVGQGKLVEAGKEYQEALDINPEYVEARNNLGFTLANLGRTEEAKAQYWEALRINPGYPEAHYSLGILFESQGNASAAVAQYREAVRLRSDWRQAIRKLAWLLATSNQAEARNGVEAVQWGQELCFMTDQRDPDAADAPLVLAAAYAEACRFPDAVLAANKAIELARANGKQELAERVERQLAIYQSGRPYREGPVVPSRLQ